MSFCCGASMIGTKGTLKHERTYIHNVPLLFCPVCHQVEVHYLIRDEYELLADYAHSDGAYEIDMDDYIDESHASRFMENCVNHEHEHPLEVVIHQIDMALDLLSVAGYLEDEEWTNQLKKRLAVLVRRKDRLLQKYGKSIGRTK